MGKNGHACYFNLISIFVYLLSGDKINTFGWIVTYGVLKNYGVYMSTKRHEVQFESVHSFKLHFRQKTVSSMLQMNWHQIKAGY